MMDYTVGSLSDLITGFKTPNKSKVVRKQILISEDDSSQPQNREEVDEPLEESQEPRVNSEVTLQKSKKTHKKRKAAEIGSDEKFAKKSKRVRLTDYGANSGNEFTRDAISKEKRDRYVKKQGKTSSENDDSKNLDKEDPQNREEVDEPLEESQKARVNPEVTLEKPKKTGKKRKATEIGSDEKFAKKSKLVRLSDCEVNNENKFTRDAISKEKREKTSSENDDSKNLDKEDPETLARTVFVGNLPITINTKQLKKIFKKYGVVEAVRIRGAPVANLKISKKVAIITKQFHPGRKSFHGYVRFQDTEEAAKAAENNGVIYKDHHLRIQLCNTKEKPDENKAIFVGNLSFFAEEEDLWKLFEPCGLITSVRIVRDGKTGVGKGFGYVNFQNADSVSLALEMENPKIKDRELRISICNMRQAKKNKNKNNMEKIMKPGKPRQPVKANKSNSVQKGGNPENKKPIRLDFQGAEFTKKIKKNKVNKGLLQKKKIMKRIAPK